MEFSINFNEEKNQLLKASRGVCFEDVIKAINEGNALGTIKSLRSRRYPNQHFLLVNIDEYIYVVPYIWDSKKKELYLKTVYPSRKFTKAYRRGNKK